MITFFLQHLFGWFCPSHRSRSYGYAPSSNAKTDSKICYNKRVLINSNSCLFASGNDAATVQAVGDAPIGRADSLHALCFRPAVSKIFTRMLMQSRYFAYICPRGRHWAYPLLFSKKGVMSFCLCEQSVGNFIHNRQENVITVFASLGVKLLSPPLSIKVFLPPVHSGVA